MSKDCACMCPSIFKKEAKFVAYRERFAIEVLGFFC